MRTIDGIVVSDAQLQSLHNRLGIGEDWFVEANAQRALARRCRRDRRLRPAPPRRDEGSHPVTSPTDLSGFTPLHEERAAGWPDDPDPFVIIESRADVRAAGRAFGGLDDSTWRWRCDYVDGEFGEHTAWHRDVDDRGWATSYADAFEAALRHVNVHADAGRLPPLPGRPAAAYAVRHRLTALVAGPTRLSAGTPRRLLCRLLGHGLTKASDGWWCSCDRMWSPGGLARKAAS